MAHRRFATFFGALTILLAGCNLSIAPPVVPESPTPLPVATSTPVLTTPTATATFTEVPTRTPTMTATLTLTPFLSGAAGELDCKVRSQSMKNGTHVNPRERFDVGWKVKNTGTATWDPSNTDFIYVSGTRMYQAEVLDLPTVVAPGDAIALSAALLSPKHPGTYMTVWALRRGENRFCRVSVEIIVP